MQVFCWWSQCKTPLFQSNGWLNLPHSVAQWLAHSVSTQKVAGSKLRSGKIKCGIFTVHQNSYVVLVVQCLPPSPGMIIPVGHIAFLNSKITTAYYWIYVSTDINECASSPCQNGGTCSDLVNSYTCNCAGGFTGGNCQTSKLSVNSYLTSVYLLYLINNSSHSYTCKTLLILFW